MFLLFLFSLFYLDIFVNCDSTNVHYNRKLKENSAEYIKVCFFLIYIRSLHLNVIFHSKQNVVQAMWLNDTAEKNEYFKRKKKKTYRYYSMQHCEL